MAIEQDLKIFISWSGLLADEITKVLRDWLPKMFDHIDPWASSTDIDAGSRGFDEIQSRLNDSSFGIIVITTENWERPWLNFEAGALSKRLDGDEKRIVPLLVGFDDVNPLLLSPLNQFQRVKLDKEGVRGLCKSIAKAIGLKTEVINHRFEAMWEELDKAIKTAIEAAGDQPEPPKLDEKELLTGMYHAVQSLQKQVSSLTHSAPVVVKHFPGQMVLPHIDPWTDGELMQATQNAITDIAKGYKPVRYVTPMERNGKKIVGVMFEDGDGLSGTDFNAFMNRTRGYGVTVVVLSDRELDQS